MASEVVIEEGDRLEGEVEVIIFSAHALAAARNCD